MSTRWRWIIPTGVHAGPSERQLKFKKKEIKTRSACAARVLIISVTHSLCVFMGSLVITDHVCARVGVTQSVGNFKPSQGDNYPTNNMQLGLRTECARFEREC